MSGLRDEGVIEFTVADPVGVSALLRAHRIRASGHRWCHPHPDPLVGDLVTRIVQAGQTLFRVQAVRKSLEQTLLELTDPLAGQKEQR